MTVSLTDLDLQNYQMYKDGLWGFYIHFMLYPVHQGSSPEACIKIFSSIVQSVVTYALPSFAADGQLSKGESSQMRLMLSRIPRH